MIALTVPEVAQIRRDLFLKPLQKQLQWPKRRPAGEGWPSRILLILWIGAEEGT